MTDLHYIGITTALVVVAAVIRCLSTRIAERHKTADLQRRINRWPWPEKGG